MFKSQPWILQPPFCRKTPKKLKGKNFWKTTGNATETERGPFSLVRCCMLRGNPCWFSSLGQQVQFGDTLKFCR